MILPQVVNILLEAVALYMLYVVVCVANRMTRETRLMTRLLIVVIGVIAMWGFLRTLVNDWPPTNVAKGHLVAMIVTALYLFFNPRIPTGNCVRSQIK